MNVLSLLLSILPGIVIIWYIYRRDKHEPEPKQLVRQAVLWGAASVIPAIIFTLSGEWLLGVGTQTDTTIQIALDTFICVGLGEELAKFVFVYYFFFNHDEFDEPLDGIVYAVCVSMGFAILENILYVMEGGLGLALLRMFTAVPAHAAFGVIMGYFVGLAKLEHPTKKTLLLIQGVFLAAIVHGAYDFFLFQNAIQELALVAILILILAVYFSMKLIRKHAKDSEQRVNKSAEEDV